MLTNVLVQLHAIVINIQNTLSRAIGPKLNNYYFGHSFVTVSGQTTPLKFLLAMMYLSVIEC